MVEAAAPPEGVPSAVVVEREVLMPMRVVLAATAVVMLSGDEVAVVKEVGRGAEAFSSNELVMAVRVGAPGRGPVAVGASPRTEGKVSRLPGRGRQLGRFVERGQEDAPHELLVTHLGRRHQRPQL